MQDDKSINYIQLLVLNNGNCTEWSAIWCVIMYTEMILDCDWSISVQLIENRSPKICNKSAKICNNSTKIVTTVQNFVANVFDELTQIPTKIEFFCST